MDSKRNYKRRNRRLLEFALGLALTAILILIHSYSTKSDKPIVREIAELPINTKSTLRYGFDQEEYDLSDHKISNNQFLGDILFENGIKYSQIAELEKKAEDIFSVRKIRAGKNYTLVKKDSTENLVCFIYEPDAFCYVMYDFRDSVQVKMVEKEVVTCIETASGTVNSSLWNAMRAQDLSISLIDKMVDALEWSIDFYHTQKGDEYKLVYERKYIDGKPVSIGDLKAAYYKNYDNEYYAFYFENEKYNGYYDIEGRPTKKAFLKSPVKFSRISSRFNYSRLHPIKKRRIPHLGTDYAAPYGTPIRAVGNGVVVKRGYTRGNGKYVKIKHDNTYSTQYLHMQKFEKGVNVGVHVKQGQTIGYVGSTGLATGPHVCFRFWKNGKQVNHLRENFPPPEPMAEEDLPRYFDTRNVLLSEIRSIPSFDQYKFKDPILLDLKEIESNPGS